MSSGWDLCRRMHGPGLITGVLRYKSYNNFEDKKKCYLDSQYEKEKENYKMNQSKHSTKKAHALDEMKLMLRVRTGSHIFQKIHWNLMELVS